MNTGNGVHATEHLTSKSELSGRPKPSCFMSFNGSTIEKYVVNICQHLQKVFNHTEHQLPHQHFNVFFCRRAIAWSVRWKVSVQAAPALYPYLSIWCMMWPIIRCCMSTQRDVHWSSPQTLMPRSLCGMHRLKGGQCCRFQGAMPIVWSQEIEYVDSCYTRNTKVYYSKLSHPGDQSHSPTAKATAIVEAAMSRADHCI